VFETDTGGKQPATTEEGGMRRGSIAPRTSMGTAIAGAAALLAAVTALAGCGGGSGDGGDDASNPFAALDTTGADTTTDTTDATTDGSSAEAPASVDPSTLPPPGSARVEVDGKVYTLEASGSIHYSCEVGDDEIRVNFQQTEMGDLTIQGSTLTGAWGGQLTFAEGDDNYGATIQGTEGLATSDTAVVYTGTFTHRTYSDPANTNDVQGTVAVNCDTGGAGGSGEAMAEIGGRTLVFPASGAQGYECQVGPTNVLVRVNRLASDDTQIEIQASQQDGQWLGNVYVISGSDRYNAIIPADGTGLEITGTTLKFAGTYAQTSESDPSSEQEVTGTASVTCP
jgi:hypothetical protein